MRGRDGRIRVPRLIAHRGASAAAPENTVAAFALAVELGADWVELDVHATADGELVVHHDYDLAGGGPIAALGRRDLPASIPTLAEALAACGPLGVNVEVKADADHPAGDAFLDAVVADGTARGGEVLVSSFDPSVVDRIHPRLPTAQLTLLPEHPPAETAAWVARRGHRAWHPWARVLDEPAVAAAHTAGLLVNTWTVDEPERMLELAAWGVDGIVTNDVALARRVLGPPE